MLPFLQFILLLSIILAAAKLGGVISVRLKQPAVSGMVLMGLILGPTALDLLHWPFITDPHINESLEFLAELGVLLLMFIAGLDLHLDDLIKTGKASLLSGGLGFILTVALGYGLAMLLGFENSPALFIGLLLAPTSIGISAQTLMELKKLRSKVGVTMLGAAVIDDILGVVSVSLFLVFAAGESEMGLATVLWMVARMILFLVIGTLIGLWVLPRFIELARRQPITQGLVATTFVTLLFYSWAAEALGHMATIIGSFMAGVFLSQSPLKEEIKTGFYPIAYGIFVPIFFIDVGLIANVRQISANTLLLLAGMVVVIVLSKFAGAWIGGKVSRMTSQEILQFSGSMIPRGEVVLIVTTVGVTEGLIDSSVFSTAVVLVVLTTLVTPSLLRALFHSPEETPEK
jgi:Kef-type K+ transport system membrane component KefB